MSEVMYDPAYEAWCEELAEDDELEREAQRAAGTGRPRSHWRFCRECGCLAVVETVIPTRQYGGGYDTAYDCRFCGWKDVAV
jgi:hypothetical protein